MTSSPDEISGGSAVDTSVPALVLSVTGLAKTFGGVRALGWKLDVIHTDGSPQQVQNAWQTALRAKPVGIIYSGTPRAAIDKFLKQADAAIITVAAGSVTDQPGDGLDYVSLNQVQFGEFGSIEAAYISTLAGGKDAKAVFVYYPDFPILATAVTNFKNTFDDACSNCTVEELGIPLTDIGTSKVTDKIVSYLRANPDVKYVAATPDSVVTGLPAALSGAGLNDVKIVGQAPEATNLEYVKAGQETATVAVDLGTLAFLRLDAVVRASAGDELQPTVAPPYWLLTKDIIDSAQVVDGYVTVTDDPLGKFKALWGVS